MYRLIVALGCLVGTASVGATDVALVVQQKPVAWADAALANQLEIAVATQTDWTLHTLPTPSVPMAKMFTDDWVGLGRESGARYTVVVHIEETSLERRKTFNIPLVGQKWELMAQFDGVVRVIDLERGRDLLVEVIEYALPLRKVVQSSADDNVHDPDLHLTPRQKQQACRHLETQFAAQLVSRLEEVMR